jgi:ABC-type nitrate/sulfonate/bicarbonate transport system permease component
VTVLVTDQAELGGAASATALNASRHRRRAASSLARLLAVVASIIALWTLIADTRVFGRSVLGPIATLRVIHDQWSLLWYNLAPTLTAAATGFGVALLIGAVGLFLMIAVPPLSRVVSAFAVFLGVVPLVAVTPALSMLFSRGSQLTALVTVLSGIIPIFAALARIGGLATGPFRELGQVYATSRWTWWRQIGLWRSLPLIDIGVKAAVPACFLGTIVAEWAGASGDRGLGEVMVNAVFSFQASLAWATIAISTAISLLGMGVVTALMAPLLRRSRA